MDFPIIDIGRVNDAKSQLSIAKEITHIQQLFDYSRSFFIDTCEDEKAPWPIKDKYVGYNSPLSDAKKDDKASMWLSGKPDFLSTKDGIEALPPFWRDKISQVEAFKHTCHGLIITLLQCFALAMDLPDRDYFAEAHAEDAGNGNQFRLICYPARGNEPLGSTTRMSPHSDSGSVTLLFQTCAGLEVEAPEGDRWVAAPYLKDHILVNLGDALAFWSGGQLKATKHCVTFDGVPHDVERMTMAYFGAASPETVLEPLRTEGAKVMERYEANGLVIPRGITVGEYSKMIMKGIYGSSVAEKEETGESEGGPPAKEAVVEATA